MRYQAVRRAERYIGLAVLAGLSSAADAQQTQASLLVSTGASIESNPYSDANTDGPSIAATAELQPQLRLRTERTTIDLRGLAQFRQFVRRFGLEDNYGLDTNLLTQVSDRTTIRTNGSFSYNQGGFGGYGRPLLAPGVPATFEPGTILPDPLTGLSDVTILGRRTRVQSLNGGIGTDAKLSAYSGVSFDLTGRSMRFKSVGFGDYNSIGSEVRFNHQLSEFTSIGAIGSVSRTDYLGTREGDARVMSILASLDRRLGANWTLAAAAGVSFSRIDQRLGLPDVKFSALTARLRFCRNAEYSRFCINGNRSPEPSANGSVRVSNAIEANYWLRTSERESFSLAGSYAHTGRARGIVNAFPAVEFVSASGRYDNQLNQTMTAFLSTSFSKIYTPLSPRRANLGVNAGVQFRFGAVQ